MGEDWIEAMVDQNIKDSLNRYLHHGIQPGGFLAAVLCNDLFGAFARADAHNKQHMDNILSYVYHELPQVCWGDRKIMAEWISKGERFQEFQKQHLIDTLAQDHTNAKLV